ncbi:hypothetical protein AVEN_121712-1 [Araneus ventricosus]|uniref:Uncharacterized protein n=1 Tax=Araneus ventricosus TaxID=182803 RepID=A0A4Y2QUH8_ARAVE|nr:hypothetical protein AVEN_121712-1 [Araneus ventricosus]
MWFERQLKKDEIPKLSNLIEFLKDHARTLQHSKPSSNKYQKKHRQKRHNSLLLIDRNVSKKNLRLSPQAEVFVPSSEPATSNMVPSTSVCANNLVKEDQNTNVLLCSAVVNILNSKNRFVSARCILDRKKLHQTFVS